MREKLVPYLSFQLGREHGLASLLGMVCQPERRPSAPRALVWVRPLKHGTAKMTF